MKKAFVLIAAFAIGLANSLWHDAGEFNTDSAVALDAVRQSRQYLVQVAVGGSDDSFDSFVYEAIHRNGNGKIMKPGDSNGTFTADDDISIELDEGISMAWSQFEHNQDVDVRILRRDGQPVGENIIIRPTAAAFEIQNPTGALMIRVPASPSVHRFSVEFADDLFT